jgi:hypothetical protein
MIGTLSQAFQVWTVRTLIWVTASILIYIALAIAFYVPVSTFGAPDGKDAWTPAFYARVSAAILVHVVASVAAWLVLARKLEVPKLVAATLSLALLLPLGYFTIGIMLFFEAR